MRQFCELLGDCRLHLRVHVPGIEHGDAAGEVDVPASFHIPQLRIACVICVYGEEVGNPARNGTCSAAMQRFVGGGRRVIRGGCRHDCDPYRGWPFRWGRTSYNEPVDWS